VVTVPDPPSPFDPLEHVLPAGSLVVRVHQPSRAANVFNPGYGGAKRFSPFDAGGAAVPTLYAANTSEAAVSETLLHDVPLSGGTLTPADYEPFIESWLRPVRDIRLAMFFDHGLRRLGVTSQQLTATDASEYDSTVKWAVAAHQAGFDGVAWMSSRHNSSHAYVFFGDRVAESDLHVVGLARSFGRGEPGLVWLISFCAAAAVDVLLN